MNENHGIKGGSLVEVVVGAAILSAVALSFLGTFSVLSNFHQKNMLSIKGSLLAEEGLEAVRFIKGSGWTALSEIPRGEPHYLNLSVSSWDTTTNPEIIDDIFYRSFRISDVERDSLDNIVNSGGIIDPDTLFVEATVEWLSRGATTTVGYGTYITNI